MNTRNVHRILPLAALLALGACSTTPGETPILSAAQIESSIRVEVRALEPLPVNETTIARAD